MPVSRYNDHFNDISMGGNISPSATSFVNGNWIPGDDNTRTLGDSTHRWILHSTSVSGSVISKSSNYTLATGDYCVQATAGAGGITITLPTAVGRSGIPFFVKRVDTGAGNVTVATTSSETIDGATSYLLTNQWQLIVVRSNGTGWIIESAN